MLRDRLKIMLVKVCFLKCLSLGRDTSLISHRYPFFFVSLHLLICTRTNLLVPYFPID